MELKTVSETYRQNPMDIKVKINKLTMKGGNLNIYASLDNTRNT